MKFNYKTVMLVLLVLLPSLAGVSEQFGYSKITVGLLISTGILSVIVSMDYLNDILYENL